MANQENELVESLLAALEEEKVARNQMFVDLQDKIATDILSKLDSDRALYKETMDKLEMELKKKDDIIKRFDSIPANNNGGQVNNSSLSGVKLDTSDLNNKLVNSINDRLLEELADKDTILMDNKELQNKLFKNRVELHDAELRYKELDVEKTRQERRKNEALEEVESLTSKLDKALTNVDSLNQKVDKLENDLNRTVTDLSSANNQKSVIEDKVQRALSVIEEKDEFIKLLKEENEKNLETINKQNQDMYELEVSNKKLELELKKLRIRDSF